MSGLKWVTVSRVLAQGLTWAITFFVIRLISPADFGLASLAGLFANFLSLMSEFGFSVAIVQRHVRDEETFRQVFGALLVLGFILAGALVALAPLLAIFVKEPRVVPLIRLISVQFLAMAFSTLAQARLSMDMRFKELSIANLIAAVSGAVVTLVMVWNGEGATGLVAGTVALSVARALLLNLYCPSIWIPTFGLSRLRELSRFSGLVLLERSLWYWYMEIDSFVVARALGSTQLGVYSVGRQLTLIPLERAMEIINQVALPAFSLVKTDLNQVRRGYLKVLRLGSAYAFPAFWGLALVSEPLVRAVIGSKWLAAVPVIQVLCISMPLRMLNSFTSAAVTAVAKQIVNIKSLVFAIIVMPSCVILGSHWGLIGVATAWAAGFPLVYLFNARLVKHALDISVRDMFAAVWPPAAASLAMVAIIGPFQWFYLKGLPPLAQLGIAVPAGAATFAASLWLISRDSVGEMIGFAKGLVSRQPA